MDLRHLQYFCAVASAGGFSRAAERLRVAQPALSRSIAKLEADLGKSLFVRHGGGVSLTEAGRFLLARAEGLLGEFEALRSDISKNDDEPYGELIFGAPSAMRGILIAPVIGAFLRRFPRARLCVTQRTSAFLREGIESGALDIAVLAAGLSASHVELAPLASESVCLVRPALTETDKSKALSLADLSGAPLILTSYPNVLRTMIEDVFDEHGLILNLRCEVDSADMMLELVRENVGWAIMPYSSCLDFVKPEAFQVTPIERLRLSWVIATSKLRADTPDARRLREMLCLIARDQIEAGAWPTAQLADGVSASLRQSRPAPAH